MDGQRPGVGGPVPAAPGSRGARPALRLEARPAGGPGLGGRGGAWPEGAASGRRTPLAAAEHLKPCGRGRFSPVGGGGQVPPRGAGHFLREAGSPPPPRVRGAAWEPGVSERTWQAEGAAGCLSCFRGKVAGGEPRASPRRPRLEVGHLGAPAREWNLGRGRCRGAAACLGLWVGIIVSLWLWVPVQVAGGSALQLTLRGQIKIRISPLFPRRLDDSGNCCKMDGILELLSNRLISGW